MDEGGGGGAGRAEHAAVDEGCPPGSSLPQRGLVAPQRKVVAATERLPPVISGEDDQSVFLPPRFPQSSRDVPHRLVQSCHHPTVSPAGGIVDMAVVSLVLRGDLQGRVDALEGEVEKHWLSNTGRLLYQSDGSLSKHVSAVASLSRAVHLLLPPEVVALHPGLCAGPPGVLEVVLAAAPVTGVRAEASPSGEVGLVTEAEVPLANHVSLVAEQPQVLGQQSQVGEQTGRFLRPEDSVLTAGVYRVPPRHQGRPGGGADRLDIALLQDHSATRQTSQVGGKDVGVVPGDVIEAKVVRHYQYYVGLAPANTTSEIMTALTALKLLGFYL